MGGRFHPVTRWLVALGAFLLVLGTGKAVGEERDHPLHPHYPPKVGHWIGDHWTPYDPPAPESFPEGSRVHRIENRDTLWDLAGHFYSDPFLWPQIWDANRYILDSHWIYPGDPLLIPPRPPVLSEVLPQVRQPQAQQPQQRPVPAASLPAPAEPAPTAAPVPAAGEARRPAAHPFADETDLECMGYIVDRYGASDLFIMGSEEPAKLGFATDDIVYLNGGEQKGISPGDEFSIVRKEGRVLHPVTGKRIGESVQRMGRLRVIAVQPKTSIAQITFACERIDRGFDLIPYEPIVSPVGRTPGFSPREVEPKGGATGYVVHSGGRIRSGAGQLLQVDLGTDDGLGSGDFLTLFVDSPIPEPPPYRYRYSVGNQNYTSVFRDDPTIRELPRRVIGQGVVIAAFPGTSVVKVTHSIREIEIGDQVERR